VPPLASQERRKRRWAGREEGGGVAAISCPSAAQERAEGRKGAFDVSAVPIKANVASGA